MKRSKPAAFGPSTSTIDPERIQRTTFDNSSSLQKEELPPDTFNILPASPIAPRCHARGGPNPHGLRTGLYPEQSIRPGFGDLHQRRIE